MGTQNKNWREKKKKKNRFQRIIKQGAWIFRKGGEIILIHTAVILESMAAFSKSFPSTSREYWFDIVYISTILNSFCYLCPVVQRSNRSVPATPPLKCRTPSGWESNARSALPLYMHLYMCERGLTFTRFVKISEYNNTRSFSYCASLTSAKHSSCVRWSQPLCWDATFLG